MRKTAASRGLHELYREDPDKADRLFFGRVTHPDRRGFLKGAGLGAMAALVGASIPFHRNMPEHFIPVALAGDAVIQGKDGLVVLNDRPLSAETPAHLLDDAITPTEHHFIRNNGIPPEAADAAGWSLTVDGLVETPLTLGIDDLRRRFDVVTAALTLECAGNGRAFFDPPADGAQWTYGAVACAEWTGVRLADVLMAAGVKEGVIYTAHEGADTHPSGEAGRLPISRGVPIAKAMDPNTLVAFAQNGAPIHPMNGAPLRLVVPGWPGSCSQKWLTRLWLRERVHNGAKMTGTSYRVPDRPLAPGEQFDETDFIIIEAMPVKSLITRPATGQRTAARVVEARGPRLGRRADGEHGPALHRFRRDLDGCCARSAGERRRLAELASVRRVSGAGLLRDLGASDGFARRRPAPRHRLEPEGLPQQRAPPRRRHGGLGAKPPPDKIFRWRAELCCSRVPATLPALRHDHDTQAARRAACSARRSSSPATG